ncbi:MAG TPA: hypothetical protein PKD78_05290 [Saprospiraceae bacterium]|nr:hypothetical protein [Saprospiraceae bacterium]
MKLRYPPHLPFAWLLCLFWGQGAEAQPIIDIQNPSFEQVEAGNGGVWPSAWKDASFDGQPLARLHSDRVKGPIGKESKHGEHYMSLLTYDNHTWQSIYQMLRQPLLKDSVYTFSIWLAHSNSIAGVTPDTRERTNYEQPAVLRMWGLNTATKQYELLIETMPITHEKWEQYYLAFKPTKANYDGFQLSAYYPIGMEDGNGNLLIDHLSHFKLAPPDTRPMNPQPRPETQVQTTLPKEGGPSSPSTPSAMIQLNNPSFELDGSPGRGTPKYWTYTGTCRTCAPVICPDLSRWRTKQKAAAGRYFVSLLTFEEGMYEGIGQRLPQRLQKDSMYVFRLKAAYSKHYEDGADAHPHPVVVCIWGYNEHTLEQEVLAQTTPVNHDFWYQYEFLLSPKTRDYDSIAIGAWFDPKRPKRYNGNLFIDDCSDLMRVHLK